ncbi:YhbY family RNA-binding protein [Candidatus Pandoraea novymonadis]|nr:YhbY family RNA-binding protein [Candidatus Pandoraea novymonadis]
MPTFPLNPRRRAELRSAAHALNPIVLISSDGLSTSVLKEIDNALDSHELIKVRVFVNERNTRIAIYTSICNQLDAAPVQHIGKLLVLYRPISKKTEALSEIANVKVRGAPRTFKVIKSSGYVGGGRPSVSKVIVRGNERLTSGGLIKKAKKYRTSIKRQKNT